MVNQEKGETSVYVKKNFTEFLDCHIDNNKKIAEFSQSCNCEGLREEYNEFSCKIEENNLDNYQD